MHGCRHSRARMILWTSLRALGRGWALHGTCICVTWAGDLPSVILLCLVSRCLLRAEVRAAGQHAFSKCWLPSLLLSLLSCHEATVPFDTSRRFDTYLHDDGMTEVSVLPAKFLTCKYRPKLLCRMEANSENEQLVDLVPQMHAYSSQKRFRLPHGGNSHVRQACQNFGITPSSQPGAQPPNPPKPQPPKPPILLDRALNPQPWTQSPDTQPS